MKKIYASLIALAAGSSLFAQHSVTGLNQVQAPQMVMSSSKVVTVDTITTYFDRNSGFYILTAGSTGYVLGTNGFTTETAEHYDDLGGATTVTELMVYFVDKEIMGAADDLVGKVYNVGADSLPTTLVAFGSVSVTDIDTSGFPTFIPMTSSTGTVSAGGFVVSVDYSGGDDSVAILSTSPIPPGAGSPADGAGERRCLQNTTAGWDQAGDIWTFTLAPPIGTIAFDADALILPIVDIGPVAVNPSVSTKEFTLKGAYPNPAVTYTNIRYTLPSDNTVSVKVFDTRGMVVASVEGLAKTAGEHEFTLDVSQFAAGNYYYQFSTENSSLISKFVVVK
jgi:hypothetical protein